MPASATSRPVLRADARRNRAAVSAAAKVVFSRDGIEAPIEAIMREAGVGRGTLYRHFPTRERLYVAVMEEQVAHLREQAAAELAEPSSWDGLERWLRLYDASATEYPGMSRHVAGSLNDGDSPVAQACAPMKSAFARLWRRAQRDGLVRSGLSARQVLTLIGGLPKNTRSGRSDSECLQVVLDGIRVIG